jgi:hypothetical protein
MMTKAFAAGVVAGGLGLATADAFAQNFRLDLFFTPRNVSSNSTVEDITRSRIVQLPAGVYRIELRYRITNLTADTTTTRGLFTTEIMVRATGPAAAAGSGAAWTRASLTNHQATNSTYLNPDATGLVPGFSGMIEPFRGGLLSDSDVNNGGQTLAFPAFTIKPLSLSNPGQWSGLTCGPTDICDPNRLIPGFGLFAFNVVYTGSGRLNLYASSAADAMTGVRFAHYVRAGAVNDPVPRSSTLATDGLLVIDNCPADSDRNGTLNSQDVFVFLADFFSNDRDADVNLSGQVTLQDVFDYLGYFFVGCV